MRQAEISSRNIVILTGAGISQESGLDTFRDAGGIWTKYNLEDVATPEAFNKDPSLVYEFYNLRYESLLEDSVAPNAAHEALAKLEKEWHGKVSIITQNVDNLHERAGSNNVIHMHGELSKATCTSCSHIYDRPNKLSAASSCPKCNTVGGQRPQVVWFGEVPLHMEKIETLLNECHLFLSIGTSGTVYPAAGFVMHVKQLAKARTIELNMEPSNTPYFDECIHGPASKVVPKYIDHLLSP